MRDVLIQLPNCCPGDSDYASRDQYDVAAQVDL